MIQIAPSVLTADFCFLGDELNRLEQAGAHLLHLDIMDGVFVPNISFGPRVVECIKSHTQLPLDVHLMIIRPDLYIEHFAKAGADIIGIHFESEGTAKDTLLAIKKAGVKSCLTIKPATPAEAIFDLLPLCDMVLVMTVEPGFGGQSFMRDCVPKITALRQEADRLGLTLDIEVDGGIDPSTAPVAVSAGANVLVVGSYLCGAADMEARMKSLNDSIQ